MPAILLLLLLQIQPDQPFKDWKVQRREPNPKTGQQEIVAFIEGDEATPIVTTRGKEVFALKGLRLRYFTDPRKPGDPSEEVRLRSDTARVDNEKDRVDLAGNVRVEKPADGTTLDAPEVVLFFRKRYVCSAHETTSPDPGKCPACSAELKSKTYTSIEAPRTFAMKRADPSTTITGEGLTGGDDLRQMRIERNGVIVTTGAPRELAAPGPTPAAAPSPKPALTEMRATGPMTFLEGAGGILVTGQRDVQVRRTEWTADDRTDLTTVTADEAELSARRGEGDRKKAPAPEKLTARGRVAMAGRDATARGDRLVWDRTGDGEDAAHLEGEPAAVDSAGNHIESRFVSIDRNSGIATFRDGVSALLSPGKEQPDAPPLRIKSRLLETRTDPATHSFSDLSAHDDVLLEGIGPGTGGKPGTAEADRFTWTQSENHGLLERRPFVRVVQGDSTIFAPRIVLEGRSTIILKGPKFVVMVTRDPDGTESRTSVTSEADIVLDSAGEKTVIRLRDRCAVRTPEVQLFADRMTLLAAKGGPGIESLDASGHVRARQIKEGATMFGEWLHFKPKTDTAPQTLTLTGAPRTTIDTGRTTATQSQVLIYEKIDPATGQKTVYQQMKGGKLGVKIVMDEK